MVGLKPNLEVLAAGPQRDIPDPLSLLDLLEQLFLGKSVCHRDHRASVTELHCGFCQHPSSRTPQ